MPAKRATGVIGAGWPQLGGCRPGKFERPELMVREQILSVTRTTMPAGPTRRAWPNALPARFDLANPCRQLLTQQAQPHGELFLGRACNTRTSLLRKPATHDVHFVGSRAGAQKEALKDHVDEFTSQSNDVGGRSE